VRFTYVTRLGSKAEWVLALRARDGGQVTIDRLKGIAESAARPEEPELTPADKVALLSLFFALADVLVIISLLWAHSWFTGPASA
jgi:hypothetical protein